MHWLKLNAQSKIAHISHFGLSQRGKCCSIFTLSHHRWTELSFEHDSKDVITSRPSRSLHVVLSSDIIYEGAPKEVLNRFRGLHKWIVKERNTVFTGAPESGLPRVLSLGCVTLSAPRTATGETREEMLSQRYSGGCSHRWNTSSSQPTSKPFK